MNVARQSVSLCQHCSLAALLGKLIELNCEHCLVCQRLGQFDFFWPIRWSISMTDPNKTFYSPSNQRSDRQVFAGASLRQVFANRAGNAQIPLYLFADHRRSSENRFL